MNVNRRNEGGISTLTSVGKTLLLFTVMMLSLPIAMYFISKNMIFEGIFLMSNRNSSFYSAVVAVVIVHVILAGFIYVSYVETRNDAEKED